MNQQIRNLLIALTAIVLGVVLFLGVQTQTQTPSLAALAETSTPIETALGNGKPTLVEFYADWCTSCRAMAGDMVDLRQEFQPDLNFVMLNVDNSKWVPEMLKYQVDGIPHFVFIDSEGQDAGSAVGEIPKTLLAENLTALQSHESLPYIAGSGTVSPLGQGSTSTSSDPRSHGAQVKS